MLCYVKGNWVEESQARISIDERGFRFGDGVFESIAVRQGQARHLSLHLQRLSEGLIALKIPTPAENLTLLCEELITRNSSVANGFALLRLSVSRGIGSRGYLPLVTTAPTVTAQLTPLPAMDNLAPAKLWLSEITKPSLASLPVQHKLMQGVNSTLARIEAAEQGCEEALLLNDAGEICEASSANIFWRDSAGIIHTPALECGLLAGINRRLLLAYWGDKVKEGRYTLEDLRHAQSVIISNAITGARAVQSLQPLGLRWNDSSLAEEVQALNLL